MALLLALSSVHHTEHYFFLEACSYLISHSHQIWFSHYSWSEGNFTVKFHKQEMSGIIVASVMKKFCVRIQENRSSLVKPLYFVWKKLLYPTQVTESWWYNNYVWFSRNTSMVCHCESSGQVVFMVYLIV